MLLNCLDLSQWDYGNNDLATAFHSRWASLVAQLVKNPPAMRETWVRSLSWEDPLEKGKATYSRILENRRIGEFWPGEFHGLYSPWGRKELDTTEQLSLFTADS